MCVDEFGQRCPVSFHDPRPVPQLDELTIGACLFSQSGEGNHVAFAKPQLVLGVETIALFPGVVADRAAIAVALLATAHLAAEGVLVGIEVGSVGEIYRLDSAGGAIAPAPADVSVTDHLTLLSDTETVKRLQP